MIAPLRHPLLLAKQLATLDLLSEGRLVVQPTVSWHEEEYEALGVPVPPARRDPRRAARGDGAPPGATRRRRSQGRHFRFADVYVEPKPFRPEGPRMWFGGQSLHPALLRRLVRYGHGFHPFGSPTPDDLARLRTAMAEAGRDVADLEMVGGIRGTLRRRDERRRPRPRPREAIPGQLAPGYTSICFKPSMFTDDIDEVGAALPRPGGPAANLVGPRSRRTERARDVLRNARSGMHTCAGRNVRADPHACGS